MQLQSNEESKGYVRREVSCSQMMEDTLSDFETVMQETLSITSLPSLAIKYSSPSLFFALLFHFLFSLKDPPDMTLRA